MTAPLPLWARWRARRVEVRPWASVTLQGAHGAVRASLLSISRGWVSVRVERVDGPRCEVWPPGLVEWSTGALLPGCSGVRIVLEDGAEHRVGAEDEARLWAWVRRAVEVGAEVEGDG